MNLLELLDSLGASFAQLLKFLDLHNGAIIAIATVLYATLTMLLLLETRAGRIVRDVANLVAYPMPWGVMYVAVRFVNYGPAIAEDVSLRIQLTKDGQPIDSSKRVHVEPLFPVGHERTFLLSVADSKYESLNELAEQKIGLELSWSWEDGRRRRLRGRRIAQHKDKAYTFATLREGFYGGRALRDKEPDEHIRAGVDELKKMRRALDAIKKEIEGPSIRLWAKEMMSEANEAEAAGMAEEAGSVVVIEEASLEPDPGGASPAEPGAAGAAKGDGNSPPA